MQIMPRGFQFVIFFSDFRVYLVMLDGRNDKNPYDLRASGSSSWPGCSKPD